MTDARAKEPKIEQPDKDTTITRKCLRCSTEFQSEWSGERVCRRCKGSNAWRSGTPAASYTTGRRK